MVFLTGVDPLATSHCSLNLAPFKPSHVLLCSSRIPRFEIVRLYHRAAPDLSLFSVLKVRLGAGRTGLELLLFAILHYTSLPEQCQPAQCSSHLEEEANAQSACSVSISPQTTYRPPSKAHSPGVPFSPTHHIALQAIRHRSTCSDAASV